MPEEPLVRKAILIPQSEMDRFKARHSAHGSFAWFVRLALKAYNDLNDIDQEELTRLAVESINVKELQREIDTLTVEK